MDNFDEFYAAPYSPVEVSINRQTNEMQITINDDWVITTGPETAVMLAVAFREAAIALTGKFEPPSFVEWVQPPLGPEAPEGKA